MLDLRLVLCQEVVDKYLLTRKVICNCEKYLSRYLCISKDSKFLYFLKLQSAQAQVKTTTTLSLRNLPLLHT